MAKIDMHVHSAYSERPSEWFLQRIGARESYVRPEQIYATAMSRGMDFITITDHNRIDGALILKDLYPEKVVVGVETTTYFPEDKCKAHVLVYGIDQARFGEIQKHRRSIYDLREYLKEEGIAHSVAHATYSINKKLTPSHLEKLILLFDAFEGINGARSLFFNSRWMEILEHLNPGHIEKLSAKHGIAPMSDTPWIKTFTAGSDDHSGLFIGTTYAVAEASSPEEVADELRNKRITPHGRHNDYKNLAFGIYKIALDFARAKNGKGPGSFLFSISEQLFRAHAADGKDRFAGKGARSQEDKGSDRIGELIRETMDVVKRIEPDHVEKRFDVIYNKISDIADEFFMRVVRSLTRDLAMGDISGLILNVSSSIPGLFLSLPFLSALGHMYENRDIIDHTKEGLSMTIPDRRKKILWFTDTVSDLNGVAETLKDLAWSSFRNGQAVKLVAASSEIGKDLILPPTTVFVPTFFSLKLPEYENVTVHFPSLLKSVEIISREDPTEIYISTPGPIGMLGLIAAKLLKVRCTGIYHTDFTLQAERIVQDSSLPDLVERGMRWFYSMTDIIKVPTEEYRQMLVDRGFEPWKLQMIPKAIDHDVFSPDKHSKKGVLAEWGITGGITLLYAGRVSRDKNLELLCEVYAELCRTRGDLNLLVAGDGPFLEEMKERMSSFPRAVFTGRLPREELAPVYASSDLFVFPSTTDTFGMVVLEAQASGLPAVVSDRGGPQEIIKDGRTGLVARSDNHADWLAKIAGLMRVMEEDPVSFTRMKRRSRLNALVRFSRESMLEQILGTPGQKGKPKKKCTGKKGPDAARPLQA